MIEPTFYRTSRTALVRGRCRIRCAVIDTFYTDVLPHNFMGLVLLPLSELSTHPHPPERFYDWGHFFHFPSSPERFKGMLLWLIKIHR